MGLIVVMYVLYSGSDASYYLKDEEQRYLQNIIANMSLRKEEEAKGTQTSKQASSSFRDCD